MEMGSCRRLVVLGSHFPHLWRRSLCNSQKLHPVNFTKRQQPIKCLSTEKHNHRVLHNRTTATTTQLKSHSFLHHYFRGLKWIILPLGFGIGYLSYLRYCYTSKRKKAKLTSTLDPSEYLASDFEIFLYRILPLKMMSRWVGWLSDLSLPVWLRSPVLQMFVKLYGCNLEEAAQEDLSSYASLGEFFCRHLKPGIRKVCNGDCLVSPADGTVLHFGPVLDDQIEQVKDITYSLPAFLGPLSWITDDEKELSKEKYYTNKLLKNKKNRLYQCVIYLAPGDYHRFHSPADWNIQYRRHFPGDLLSVNPGFVSWIAGLFTMNERVAYVGEWKHGFFALVAVGATSVGSVRVYCDQDLTTNCRKLKKGAYQDKTFLNSDSKGGIGFKKGDAFGEFNFGSTIVVLMEGPEGFEFKVEPDQKVHYGELLFTLGAFKSDR